MGKNEIEGRYTVGSVTSQDGTTIGYRQFGQGPGLLAVHGGMQCAENLTKLAVALADSFTVYVMDRRGRGLSGALGDNYSLEVACADINAVLTKTGCHNVFGLSSGALISLQAALSLPMIQRVALYEPPLSINRSTPVDWLPRYDREVAQGALGSAMVTAMKGSQVAPLMLRLAPRILLDPMMNLAVRSERDESTASGGAVPLRALVPTMHHDVQLVLQSEGRLESFSGIRAQVLLLGGSKSPTYLKTTLDVLSRVVPNATRHELPGLDHLAPDNGGQPKRIARELRSFFTAT